MDDLEYCDITPWYNEVCTRMHEAHAAGTMVVVLGSRHPRGFIPGKILRRKAIRELLKGWQVDTNRDPPEIYPVGNIWSPAMGLDFNTCDLAPFIHEMEVRTYEAEVEAYNKTMATGEKHVPVVDLTNFHPRGGIPEAVMLRLERRKSRKWQDETRAEAARLRGEANKAEAFSRTQRERAIGAQENGKDPAALIHAADQLLIDAAQFREQAKFLEREVGGA